MRRSGPRSTRRRQACGSGGARDEPRPMAARVHDAIDRHEPVGTRIVTIPGRPTRSMRPEMSELTRPIRRLFGRGDRPADVVTEPAVAEPPVAAAEPSRDPRLDRGGHRRIRPAARLSPDGARTGRAGPPRARLARGPRPARGRRRARRPARLAGRADRHAQPRAAAVRAGLLHRRPSPADDPRRPGRARPSASPSSSASRPPRPPNASASSRRCASRRSSSSSSCRASCRTCREWQIAAYYGPARAVGGDFYDFIEMRDGRIGIAVGDVTDKGVPAALVMARTHSVLRAEASRSDSPGEILARANALLEPEMPARMFVTCLFAILDPSTGRIVMANAGHNLPYIRTDDGRHRAARHRDAPRPPARDHVRRDRGRHRSGKQRPALLRRARRGPRPEPGDVRLPAPARGDGRRRRRQRAARSAARHPAPVHRPGLGAGGRHHPRHPAPSLGRRRTEAADDGQDRARPRHGVLDPGRGRATSAWPWTGSRPPSPTSDSRRRGSNGSRRPSARPR